MTTITIKNSEELSRTSFEDWEEVQLYILQAQQEAELSDAHKKVLDARLLDLKNNPDDAISYKELKASITRKHV